MTRVSRIKVIHRQLMVHKNAYIFLKPVDPVYWEIQIILTSLSIRWISERLTSVSKWMIITQSKIIKSTPPTCDWCGRTR